MVSSAAPQPPLRAGRAAATVLLVEDEAPLRLAFGAALEGHGYAVVECPDVASARAAMAAGGIAAVVSDLRTPTGTGLELLADLRNAGDATPFVLMTGYASVESAVAAMKYGAADFLEKPIDLDDLCAAVDSALGAVERAAGRSPQDSALVGDPSWLDPFMESLERIAATDATVLIEGETGTGKTAIARLIHARSARAAGPFVEVNCASIPEHLVESELFGHVRGAFTGAVDGRAGRVEIASGGSLLLDEVGDLRLDLQAKLLHLLQERRFTPVGAPRDQAADVRFIAATNQDLLASVAEGRVRADLYHRLNVISLYVEPLRRRTADIPLLIDHFCRQVPPTLGSLAPRFAPATLDVLLRYPWPGNIRELRNLVERHAVLRPGAEVRPEHLRRSIRDAAHVDVAPVAPPSAGPPPEQGSLRDRVQAYEQALITDALRRTDGNRSAAARLLGIKRTTLVEKIKRIDEERAAEARP